jgi:hypothetical protein
MYFFNLEAMIAGKAFDFVLGYRMQAAIGGCGAET